MTFNLLRRVDKEKELHVPMTFKTIQHYELKLMLHQLKTFDRD
jgi:hypothetical protein